jgi:hypothetical protein
VQKYLDNAKRYIPVRSDDSSITLYHGSPTKGIKDLDINMAGKNTMSGEKAIYFTDDFPTAETFSYERNPSNSMFVNNKGKKGEVYTRNVNTNNFLDLDNLTDDQIVDLYNYIDPRSAGLMDKNKFVQTLNDARAAGNSQMIKAQLDLNKLADDYDGFIAKMYPGENDVREYGVFNPQNIITPDVEQYLPKKLAISGDDDMVTLFHNTKAENIPSIMEQGLIPGKRLGGYLVSPEEAGIWTDDRGLTSGSYGGTTVKIRVPKKEFDATRVNDTQNLINRVIKPSEIEGVDDMLFDTPLIKNSNLQEYIDKYGEDKVRSLIEKKGLVSPEVVEEAFSGLVDGSNDTPSDVLKRVQDKFGKKRK